MSENGEQRESGRADPGPKWVWVSTEASVERGAISVLACAEVAAGIGLYWWLIPWWFETNLHLLISVLVAPLLLLRSPASVAAALAAFERFGRDEDFSLRSKRGAVAMLLAAGPSAVVAWGLAETWLGGHDGWNLFWRAGIIGWIGVQIGIAGAVAGAVAVAGARAVSVGGAVAVAVAGAVTGAVAGAVAGAGPGAVAGAVAGAGAVAAAGAAAATAARAGARAVARARAVAVALIGPGMLLGIWLWSVIVKMGSTLRHWKEGWRRLSVNWRGLVWAHDLRRPPELLPGIDRVPGLSVFGIGKLLSYYKSHLGAARVLLIVVAALALPIFFLPAWFYRLSLKSTCWFWWPLVFSQTSGRAAARAVAEGGIPGAVVVFKEQSETWLARFLFGLSLTFLVAAIGVPERLLALLPVSGAGVDLLNALGDMIYLMLPCAGVQLVLFLFCNQFLPRVEANHLGSRPRIAFCWLVSLRQFLLWSALFAALALYLENWLPVLTPFAGWVEAHYFSWFPLLTWT